MRKFLSLIAVVGLAACATDAINEPHLIASATRRLGVGEATVCALDPAGKVFCWGTNSALWWEYGADSALLPPSASPVAVPVSALARISGGTGPHTCGLTASNSAVCWGRGGWGQLGGGVAEVAARNPPTPVQPAAAWADIAVARLSTCAVALDGGGYCWGSNQRGEIGSASIALGARTGVPTRIDGVVFRSIVPGWIHACGIATSGAAYCWGDNSAGQLGIGFSDPDEHREPLLVSLSERFEQLSLGARTTCGITVDHRALCWGLNATGQLGDETTVNRPSPTLVAGGLKFRQIAVGSGFAGGTNVPLPNTQQGGVGHTCALTETGAPYCWGWNAVGQVGDGSAVDRLSPVPVQGNLQLSMIGAGGSSTCGMKDKAVWCWGSNLRGQLGDGTFVNASVPVRVKSPFATP